uniref:Uncharacterized protein n=1 Tax=Acrobeloides nanus TaxID=290746 RepID=A0A914C4T7_9BILA
MASSRGRSLLAERKQKKTFAFGSSTPRELSYINTVPPKLRIIGDNQPDKGSKQKDQKQTPQATNSINGYINGTQEEHNISYYMRMARSLTPKRMAEKEIQPKIKCWAFGSSTPREFSHLNRIKPELRVYDAKVIIPPGERSQTVPDVAQFHPKPHKPAPKVETRKISEPTQKPKLQRRINNDDEIASEPDIVQDRGQDFEEFLRQYQINSNVVKDKNSDSSSHTPTPEPTKPEMLAYEEARVKSFLADLNQHTQEPVQTEAFSENNSEKLASPDETPRNIINNFNIAENAPIQEPSSNGEIKENLEALSKEEDEGKLSENLITENRITGKEHAENEQHMESEVHLIKNTPENKPSTSDEKQETLGLILPKLAESPRPGESMPSPLVTPIQDEVETREEGEDNISDLNQARDDSESHISRKIHYKNGQQLKLSQLKNLS